MSAEDLGWGRPGLSRSVRVECAGIPLNVRPEVAPLFAELIRWLREERARHGSRPLLSAGGYAMRPIRGYEDEYRRTQDSRYLSNHSWGTATDFNPTTNPMQATLVTDMPPGTSAKAASLGMRWGGDFAGRKDPMHFEIAVSPDEAARIIAGLDDTPTPPKEDDMTPQQAEQLSNVEALLGQVLRELAEHSRELDMLRRDNRAFGKKLEVEVES